MRMENEVETAMRKQIDELSAMPVGQLRQKYLEVFGEESRSSHTQFLFRRIAWRLLKSGRSGKKVKTKRGKAAQSGVKQYRYPTERERIERIAGKTTREISIMRQSVSQPPRTASIAMRRAYPARRCTSPQSSRGWGTQAISRSPATIVP